MKKVTIIIIVVCFALNSFSQNYFKFPTSNAVWNYIITGSMSPPYEWIVVDSFGQLTSIGSNQYVEIYSVNSITGAPVICGALREDTILKKVYFNNNTFEEVLYDFSLNIGDTIHYTMDLQSGMAHYKTVESIDSVSINGIYRKRWNLENSGNLAIDIWVEGIGSIYRYGLLNPIYPDIPMDGSITYFGCFKHNNTTYFNDTVCASNCCPCTHWLVQINEIDISNTEVMILPNPASDFITIDFGTEKHMDCVIEIYNVTGILVRQEKLASFENKFELDVKALINGLYLGKIINSKGQIRSFKFVVE